MISYSIDRTKRYHYKIMRRNNRSGTNTNNTNTTTTTDTKATSTNSTTNTNTNNNTNTNTNTNTTSHDTEYSTYDQSSPVTPGFPSSRSISPTSSSTTHQKETKSGLKDGKGRLSGSAAAVAADVRSSCSNKGDLNLTATEDSLPSIYTTASTHTNTHTNNKYIDSITTYRPYIMTITTYTMCR